MSSKNSGKKMFVEHFLYLQNHFLKNSYPLNILVEHFFYRWKIISSKLVIHETFWSKKVLVEKFLLLQNHFLKNSYPLKMFTKICLVENILSLKNHFLKNSYPPKMLPKKIWMEIFYRYKIISSKIVIH